MKKLVLFILLSLLTQLTFAKKGDHGPWKWNEVLPGSIQLDTNFYADQLEMTNYNWLEYMYWVKRILALNHPNLLLQFLFQDFGFRRINAYMF